ncbi:unnamed protein product [Ilex paraguariensis]|uniref:GST C-terminal domain-containing protein n=1 Tax=Ilex paraguariensis TaxID=185542 RepID=A0ABC8RWR9_9AQUA
MSQNILMKEPKHNFGLTLLMTRYGKLHRPILATFHKVGEDKEKSAKEARENLKILESGLQGKCFFGGETLGFVDIAAGWIAYWARMIEDIVDVMLIDEENISLLNAWFQDVLEVYIIKECVLPSDKLLMHNKGFHKILMAAST